jgi:phage terminase large subunit-like protein
VGQVLDALAVAGIDNTQPRNASWAYRRAGQLGRAIKTLERHLADGSFVHGAQPLMAWCESNGRIEQRANSILITKQAGGIAKIDPLAAMLNATDLMAMNPEPGGSVYSATRGLLSFG